MHTTPWVQLNAPLAAAFVAKGVAPAVVYEPTATCDAGHRVVAQDVGAVCVDCFSQHVVSFGRLDTTDQDPRWVQATQDHPEWRIGRGAPKDLAKLPTIVAAAEAWAGQDRATRYHGSVSAHGPFPAHADVGDTEATRAQNAQADAVDNPDNEGEARGRAFVALWDVQPEAEVRDASVAATLARLHPATDPALVPLIDDIITQSTKRRRARRPRRAHVDPPRVWRGRDARWRLSIASTRTRRA